MEIHIKIIGWIMIALASIHLVFPRYFQWNKELGTLSLINKQLMYVHTFFIALVVMLMGLFCLVNSRDIIHTEIGKQFALGLFVFWLTRLFFQFFVYSTTLWKGKKFETFVHVFFSLLWIYFSGIFLLASGIY